MKNGVSFKVFIWAIGIIFIVIGYLFNSQKETNQEVRVIKDGFYEIKTEMGIMGANVGWMRASFEELKEEIKSVTYENNEK